MTLINGFTYQLNLQCSKAGVYVQPFSPLKIFYWKAEKKNWQKYIYHVECINHFKNVQVVVVFNDYIHQLSD